jgi:hypothetical protein
MAAPVQRIQPHVLYHVNVMPIIPGQIVAQVTTTSRQNKSFFFKYLMYFSLQDYVISIVQMEARVNL